MKGIKLHPHGLCPALAGGECRHKGLKHQKPTPWASDIMKKRKARFEREEILSLILAAIDEEKRHGYNIMQHILDRTGGTYRPSPGVLYPALQTLEGLGFVSSSLEGKRKIYLLTEKGKKEVEAKRPLVEDIYEAMGQNQNSEWESFFVKAHDDITGMFRSVSRSFRKKEMSPDRADEILEIIRDAAAKVGDVLNRHPHP